MTIRLLIASVLICTLASERSPAVELEFIPCDPDTEIDDARCDVVEREIEDAASPAQEDSSSTSPNEPAEVEREIETEVEFDCSRSFCGCWSNVELEFTTTVNDPSGHPLQGIELRCERESDPIAVSDRDGNASFAIVTKQSPGCGYLRCSHLAFSDPGGHFEAPNTTYYQADRKVVVLRRRE